MDRILPNFIYAFVLARIRLGLLPVIFSQICDRGMTLDLCSYS